MSIPAWLRYDFMINHICNVEKIEIKIDLLFLFYLSEFCHILKLYLAKLVILRFIWCSVSMSALSFFTVIFS